MKIIAVTIEQIITLQYQNRSWNCINWFRSKSLRINTGSIRGSFIMEKITNYGFQIHLLKSI